MSIPAAFDWNQMDGTPMSDQHAKAFQTHYNSVVSYVAGFSGSVHAPVADETALVALTDHTDKMMILVESLGQYRYDAESVAAEVVGKIRIPTDVGVGAGRWIRFTELDPDHNSLESLQGGAAGEYYHMTSSQNTRIVTMGDNAGGGGLVACSAGATRVITTTTIARPAGVAFDNLPTQAADAAGAGLVLQSAAADKTQAVSIVVAADIMTMIDADKPVAADTILVSKGAAKDAKTSAVLYTNLATMAANIVAGNLAQGDGAKGLADSGKATANVVTMAANGVIGELLYTPAADKAAAASGIHKDNVVTMAAPAIQADEVLVSAGANKITVASGVRLVEVARRVLIPVAANLCGMDADGDPVDSGVIVARVPQQAVNATAAEEILLSAAADKTQKSISIPLTQMEVAPEVDCTAAVQDHTFVIPAAWGGNWRVKDFYVADPTGGAQAGATVQLRTAAGGGGAAVTDAVSIALANQIGRAAEVYRANGLFAAGATVHIRKNAAGTDAMATIVLQKQ